MANPPARTTQLPPPELIERRIYLIRGHKVMLDSHLAELYEVPTFRLNEAVKRNRRRFPEDFMFQVRKEEAEFLTSQIAISKRKNSSQNAMSKSGRGGRRTLPYAFTEHGALQAANVLRSSRAVQMSVFVIRAFVKMRETLLGTRELAKKLAVLEKKLTSRLDVHEAAIVQVLREVMQILNPPPEPEPPRRRIGFDQL